MVLQDKAAFRAQARMLRRRLADANPHAAAEAALHVADLPHGDVIAVYCAMGSELDPEPLACALIALGRVVCLPVVVDRDAPMIFRRWLPGDPLEEDAAGCPAPLPLAETVVPDLIIAPLLAFDAFGGRLGQGGGYYDRTFAAYPGATRIGLAYAGQAMPQMPMEKHDVLLHYWLAENGLHPCIWR